MPPEPRRAVPVPLLVALAFVLLEAAALAVLAGGLVVDLLSGAARNAGATVGLVGFYVLFAVGLGLAGRAVLRGRRWARGPLITWQLLMGASAIALGSVFQPWVTVALLVAAVGVVAGLMWPSSREYLERDPSQR